MLPGFSTSKPQKQIKPKFRVAFSSTDPIFSCSLFFVCWVAPGFVVCSSALGFVGVWSEPAPGLVVCSSALGFVGVWSEPAPGFVVCSSVLGFVGVWSESAPGFVVCSSGFGQNRLWVRRRLGSSFAGCGSSFAGHIPMMQNSISKPPNVENSSSNAKLQQYELKLFFQFSAAQDIRLSQLSIRFP
nr:hypothetical protein CFP56_78220 [Quercus suber]